MAPPPATLEGAPGSEINTADGMTYTVMNLLGHGTFAKVYRCVCKATEEAFAVKVVSVSRMRFSPDFEAQELMITREVEILKKLRHERICNMHDFLRTEENWYLVMELVCNGELFHNIPPNKGMRELEAKYVFQQLLEGIGYIHSKGVIHRDLKPENILIVRSTPVPAPDGHTARLHDIKIADFGLSKVREGENTMANSCVGSPVYAAPEIFSERGYGQSVDTWSLGAILFVMLCGQYPFDGRTMPQDITLGNVAQVSGCVGAAGVDSITFERRDGEARSYASSVDTEQVFTLQRDERIVAVTQELGEKDEGKLGRSVAFYTTQGQIIALDGPTAGTRGRYTAPPGSQISGLEFDGSRLVGITVVKSSKSSKGAVARIRGWRGDCVDGVEFQLRDGSVSHYGGDGGFLKGPWDLEEKEKILAVSQEQSDRYLSNSLALFTSFGNIIELEGAAAKPSVRFAVPFDHQIERLKFEIGGRLSGAVASDDTTEVRCANFRMDLPRWNDLAQEARDMVCGLLRVEVEKRWTLEECLGKPWMRDPLLPYQDDEDFQSFVKRGSKNDLISKAAEAAREFEVHEESRAGSSPSIQIGDADSTPVDGATPTVTPGSSAPVSPTLGQTPGSPTAREPRSDNASGELVDSRSRHGRKFFSPEPRAAAEDEPVFGAVQVIRGRLGSAVDRVEFQMWKGHTLCYGGHGGGSITPWKLKPNEFITAVEQERRDGDLGYLGNELAFFTSAGRVHTITGSFARNVHRFSSKAGYEISGLKFEGSRLTGVHMSLLQHGQGSVVGIDARLADCLDQVQLHLRSGKRLVYGAEGGRPQGLIPLGANERITGVAQEDFNLYLGMGIAFFTSSGRVIAFDGYKAGRRSRFAAPDGQQIFGLHFEESRLVDVLARTHSARPRGASKEKTRSS